MHKKARREEETQTGFPGALVLKRPVGASKTALLSSLAFSSDNTLLASATYDSLYLWDAKTGIMQKTIKNISGGCPSCIAISEDNAKVMYIGNNDGDRFITWTLATDDQKSADHGPTRRGMEYLRLHSDGTAILSEIVETELPREAMREAVETHGVASDPVFVPSVLSKDKRFFVWRTHAHCIVVWDLQLNQHVNTLRGGKSYPFDLTISPNGKFVVCTQINPEGEVLRLWTCDDEICKLAIKLGDDIYSQVIAISADSKFIAVGDSHDQISIWEPDWPPSDDFNADEAFADIKSAAKTK